MSQTVGCAIIARNVEKTIRNCIESFIAHVDQVVVVKAGESTDETPKILDELKAKYPDKLELYSFEWCDDFSAARNYSFSKLKTDWWLWVDADDIVYQPENLRILADNAPADVGFYWFPYHYAMDEFGNLTTNYIRERLLRAKQGWIWAKRLHETVAPINPCKYLVTDDVIIRHEHLAGASRKDRNFKILNIMQKEDPKDKRVWLYLGHQNFASGYWAEACKWYLQFGRDTGAIPLERYQALCYCSKAFREMRDEQAVDVALSALELFPQFKDAYLELAHTYLVFGNYEKAIHFAKMSDVKEPLMTEPPAVIFINPLEYTFNKYALLAECYLKRNDFKTAKEYVTECQKIRPTQDIQNNLNYIESLIRKERVKDGIRSLAVELLDNKEVVKLPSLLAACPSWYRETSEYDDVRNGVMFHTKDIVDKPEINEAEDKSIVVNLANALNPEELLGELDKKYEHITVIAPIPSPESKQVNVYGQKDIEAIVTSRPGRHIINLKAEPTRIVCEYDRKLLAPTGLAVRFYIGQGLEYWSPKTIKEAGCGGSETSAAWLAKSLAAKGCQPIIYAMANEVSDGVIYRPHPLFSPNNIQTHLFISSRVPDVFDNDIPAMQKWLWMHDICCWDRLTVDRAEKINCIIVLSHWHAEHIKRVYPFLKNAEIIDLDDQDKTYEDTWTTGIYYPDDVANRVPKIAIIGDAIDTSRFQIQIGERVPYRFIWCSSPDRGLEELLNMWPLIKKEMPEATLKIFYGWEYFDTSLHIPAQREFKQRIRRLIDQDGVQWCGRVGQTQLSSELKQSDAMIYPPHPFRETYGIAFLEAQAAGVICFYRQNGALGETIGDRGVSLSMDSTPEQIVNIVKTTLADKEACDIIRTRAITYGMKRDWSDQADKIIALYRSLDGK